MTLTDSDEMTAERPAAPTPRHTPRAGLHRRLLVAGTAAALAVGTLATLTLGSDDRSALEQLAAEWPAPAATSGAVDDAVSVQPLGPVRLADALPNVQWQDGTGVRPASVDVFVGHVIAVEEGMASRTEGPHPMEGQQVNGGACDDTARYCSLLAHVVVDDPLGGPSKPGDTRVVEITLRGPGYATGAPEGANMAPPEDVELWKRALVDVGTSFWLLQAPTTNPQADGRFSHPRLAAVDGDGRIVPQFATPETHAAWFGDLTTIAAVREARQKPGRTIDQNEATRSGYYGHVG